MQIHATTPCNGLCFVLHLHAATLIHPHFQQTIHEQLGSYTNFVLHDPHDHLCVLLWWVQKAREHSVPGGWHMQHTLQCFYSDDLRKCHKHGCSWERQTGEGAQGRGSAVVFQLHTYGSASITK